MKTADKKSVPARNAKHAFLRGANLIVALKAITRDAAPTIYN